MCRDFKDFPKSQFLAKAYISHQRAEPVLIKEKTSPTILLSEPATHPYHEINGVSRGVGVIFNGVNLVGEGMGIGGVIGLVGRKAVFPLHSKTRWWNGALVEKYHELNGISLKYLGPFMAEKPYKSLRTILSPIYIRHRGFRPIYSLLMAGRTVIGLRSRYMKIKPLASVRSRYILEDSCIRVEIHVERPKGLSILVANELSGRLFTTMDVNGRTTSIPPWIEVSGRICFHSPQLGLAVSLEPVDGCRMFAGREVLGKRLDWAGLSYQMPHELKSIRYRVFFDWLT
jgi:hypothetical protein